MDLSIKPSQGAGEFDAMLEQAVRADDLGFSGVYLSEHHGHPIYWPTPLLALGAIASHTEDVELGTAVKLLPLHNPVHLAGRIALLDRLSDGRARMGFGLGWDHDEFDAYGIPRSERGARMTEYLELMNDLFEPGPTTFDGDFYAFEDFELFPRHASDPRPGMLVGGTSDQAYHRATDLADGWVSPGGELAELAAYAEEYRDSAADPGDVVITNQGTVVRETEDAALDGLKRLKRAFHEPLIERGHPYSPSQAELEEMLGSGFDGYVEERALVAGTPDQAIDKLQRIEAATGADEIVLRISTCGLPKAEGLETLELLAEDVLPSF
jgi:alkanesulfonate monooxygenase SsuD/methylene tetrahydromethanopterin reductase-like flavin-dependent oxidoreductase (luciferase family)